MTIKGIPSTGLSCKSVRAMTKLHNGKNTNCANTPMKRPLLRSERLNSSNSTVTAKPSTKKNNRTFPTIEDHDPSPIAPRDRRQVLHRLLVSKRNIAETLTMEDANGSTRLKATPERRDRSSRARRADSTPRAAECRHALPSAADPMGAISGSLVRTHLRAVFISIL